MRRSGSAAAFFAFFALTFAPAAAAPKVYVGLQGILLTGAHTDIAGTQHGAALGAILQAGVRGNRVGLRLEGIPPVSLPQKPSAFYGQATPQLSLIDGAVQAAIDRRARFWFGAGETVINQRTPLPNLSQVVSSRLGGVRFEALYRSSFTARRFWEVLIGATPRLNGSDYYVYSVPQAPIVKSEAAAEEDAAVTWGLHRGNTELLFGVRIIDFSARYTATGLAGDRNNGGGAMVEWRRFLDK